MKSFAMKEMWKFSQFQLKEMFGYGKKKAFIQLLFLRSFSICVFCALVSGDSLKECLSLIEQLLILLSYYFTFWSLVEVLGISTANVGIALSSYTIGLLCVRPFSGFLVDCFSRKPLYLFAFFVFAFMFGG